MTEYQVPKAIVERAARAMQIENRPKPDPLNRDQREEQDEKTIDAYRTLARVGITAALAGLSWVDPTSPPPGWFTFGTHAGPGACPPMEFYGTGEDGLPIWERPINKEKS